MSRFYLSAVNSRGNTVTAAGASHGQDCHIRGWRNGVSVFGKPDPDHPDRDLFDIFATSGSGYGGEPRQYIGTVRLDENGDPTFIVADRWVKS